eukprot:scaffold47039_cov62-Cyclotella_meneghiniana.AAC.3
MLRLEFIINNHRHTLAPVASTPARKPPNMHDLDLLTTSIINEHQLINNNEIYSTPARKPPNMHDLDLLTTSIINEHQLIHNNEIYSTISSCNVLIEQSINCHQITKTPIPYDVHNTFMLENVLSAPECDRLLAATEMAGYCPDEPLEGQPGASILAHACVLVVDHLMEHTILDRVKRFLPSYEQPTEQPETFNPLGIN